MANSYTQVTTKGYGTRIGNSVGAAIAGFLMFLVSFGLLYWNEGRTDLSSVAKNAVEVPSSSVSLDAALQDKLVSVSGEVTSDDTLGDDLYLKPGNYLLVERTAEMYAWVEKVTESSNTNVGGSETTTTTYDYVTEWTDDPKQENEFEYPEDHENPNMTIANDDVSVETLNVGVYSVDGSVDLPVADELSLKKEMLSLSGGAELAGNYVFLGSGSLGSPELGDIRVSYRVVEAGFDGTVMGALDGEEIVGFVDEEGNELFRVFTGSRDAAISTLHEEFVVTTWILRFVGFLLMWFGLAGILGPIATLLDILPFLGSTTRFIASLVTFPVALVLSVVTILVSAILHNPIALIITVLVVVGLLVLGAKKLRKPAAPMAV